jgi:hypothetical protein
LLVQAIYELRVTLNIASKRVEGQAQEAGQEEEEEGHEEEEGQEGEEGHEGHEEGREKGQEEGQMVPMVPVVPVVPMASLPQRACAANLLSVKAVLDKHSIRFWLSEGTALGAVRDGAFIRYDDDVDLGLLFADHHRFFSNALPELLQDFGFVVGEVEEERCGRQALFVALLRDGEKVDLDFTGLGLHCKANFRGDCSDTCDSLLPLLHSQDGTFLRRVRFLGSRFEMPAQAAEYLRFLYGTDWRTPRRGWKP